MRKPLMSICIPSYERIEYLKRLLDSINIQTFKDFEVILCDDSETNNIQVLVENYNIDFPISYYKNNISLGSAKNMHECLKHAHADWIKIIHDDDWLSSKYSLQQYATAITSDARFIFSGYNSYYDNIGKYKNETISSKEFTQLIEVPSLIFAQNAMGPPSVLMFHSSVKYFYDVNLKWFVDVEYYFRIFATEKAIYITEPLINVSFNDSQITSYTKRDPVVVIPESLYILNKYGEKVTSNIFAYDSWWRLYRNLEISSFTDLKYYAKGLKIPPIVKNIIRYQSWIPRRLIKIGVISKCCMAICYVFSKLKR